MDLESAALVIVPGVGGSGPQQWQSLWQVDLPGAVRIAPRSWEEPELKDWLAALDRAADDAGGGDRVLVAAHSLGCRAAALWASRAPERVAGLFCVAPPSVPAMVGVGVAGFEVADHVRPPVPVLVVASSDDPHAGLAISRALARAWSASLVEVGALGHINDQAGLGAWPQGLGLLRAFAAGL